MGIPDILAARLIETIKEHGIGGAVVMLGRQRFGGRGRAAAAQVYDAALTRYLPGLSDADLRNLDDGYAERFFEQLGFETVDSLDFSDFEGASIVQDLAATLAPTLRDRFDLVYDGGTCEHVFDLPTAYRNIDRMLKPGGVFIAHTPANNWINHGFFQVCPEVVYGFWAKAMGYDILECVFQPLRPRAARRVVSMTNPLQTGKRPRLLGALPVGMPVLLNYAVRKPLKQQNHDAAVKQTDYAARWAKV